MSTVAATRSKTPSRVPVHILDDLSSKFLINLPEAEKNDLIRLFFQIELAHWFFLDFYCTQEENTIYVCGIKQFALLIFQHIPSLNHHVPNLSVILDEWRSYKISVPTYGTILLTPDMKKCLLVQSFFAKNSWSFPKGKVNENEDPVKCAIREVYEETGFDCGHLIDENAFIEGQTSNFQYTRLYIVKNVPVDTKFAPRTRNEIKDCSWFTVDELPTNRNDDGYFMDQKKIRANSFYMILPFISKLKHWIASERLAVVMGNRKKNKRQQQPPPKGNKHKHINNNNSNNNNGDHHHNNNLHHSNQHSRNSRTRHKSCGDSLDRFSPGVSAVVSNGNGTFYNDNLKIQNTSTPITYNNGPLVPSSASAFRATNNLSNSFNKKKQQNINQQQQTQQQQVNKNNGKVYNNNNGYQASSSSNGNQEHIKRKLFALDLKENVMPLTDVKPFQFEIPDSWKNFKFDHKKIINSV